MEKKIPLYLAVFVCVILAQTLYGCVSVANSPSPKLYMPHSAAKDQIAEKFSFSSGVFIGVGPVNIPEYLNRPQIVTRGKDGLMNIAQFDRWAEYLDASMLRMIDEDLELMLPEAHILKFTWNILSPIKYQVGIDVIRMESDLDNNLSLLVHWNIFDLEHKKAVFSKSMELIQPISPHDYSGLCEALSKACLELSMEIAKELSAIAK